MSSKRKQQRETQQLANKRQKQTDAKLNKQVQALGIKVKGTKKFIVQLSCGCCDADVYFREEQTLVDQIRAQGFTVGGVITDDLGQTVDSVDTFYGYRSEKETSPRSLEYLLKRIIRNVN